MEDKVLKRAPYRAWILWTRRSHHPKTCIQRQIGSFSLPDCHLSVILEWSDHTSICISQGMNTHGLRSFLDRPSNMLLLPYPGQDIRWDHASSEIPICRNNPWYWWNDLRSLRSPSLKLVTGLPRTDGSCQWREWPQHVRWSYHVEPSLVENSQNTYELLTSAVRLLPSICSNLFPPVCAVPRKTLTVSGNQRQASYAQSIQCITCTLWCLRYGTLRHPQLFIRLHFLLLDSSHPHRMIHSSCSSSSLWQSTDWNGVIILHIW